MNFKAMNLFLSEENIKRHLEYLRTLRLKYSILEKGVPEIKGKGIKDITMSSLNRKIKDEAMSLLWQIKTHEVFFNSFSESPIWPDSMKKQFSSREKFLYDLMIKATDGEYGYLYIFSDNQKRIRSLFTNRFDGAFLQYQPLLCIDLYEHSYFCDYGFAKDKFIKGALAYLDTGKL